MRRSVQAFLDGIRGLTLTDQEYYECLMQIDIGRRRPLVEVDARLPLIGNTEPSQVEVRLECLKATGNVGDADTAARWVEQVRPTSPGATSNPS